jgi:NADH dehydrogenase FAD-containing subunit
LLSVSEYIRAKIEEKLNAKGIKVLTNTKIIRVNEDEVFLSDLNSIKTKTLVWTGGI